MTTNDQLNFLQEKIQDIGSAIFFNLSDSVLKLPTSIVTTLKVDEYGYVWFFIQKPKQNLNEFESDFPARLDFFKKGKHYFLQVIGKAWVISDPEVVNSFVTLTEEAKGIALNQMVLVKVKMLKADYYNTETRTQHSKWQSAVSTLFTIFRNPGFRSSTTYLPAS